MKICAVKTLIEMYGADATLGQVLNKLQGNKIYKCPKCEGKGFITVEYNGYPAHLPDSGFVYEPAFKDIKCDLCNGEGYTDREYRPRMVQDGWE